MGECVQWSSPTFTYEGNLASLQPRAKPFVSLMFQRGSEIPGEHPLLERDAALVRTMRMVDVEAVVRAWCELKGG